MVALTRTDCAVARARLKLSLPTAAPVLATGLAFLILFWQPLVTLGRDWWTDPEAGHGLLLAPLAVFLARRRGFAADTRGQPIVGITILAAAVVLRHLSGLAAELFTMRASMLAGIAGLVVYCFGLRQLLHWWLPALLLVLSVPLPKVVLGTLALPLQLKASQLGAALLEWRQVPVRLSGNIIQLPGRALFVTEACSGLRSLTALVAIGVLVGGLWLKSPWSRILPVVTAIPVAVGLNGLRVFLTGYLVYYVDPSLADGVMHVTEGWALFLAAFAILGAITWFVSRVERRRWGEAS